MFLPFLAFFGTTGRSERRRGETGISSTATASLCRYKSLAVKQEVLQNLSCLIVLHEGSRRDSDDKIFSVLSGLIFSSTVTSFLGAKLFGVG